MIGVFMKFFYLLLFLSLFYKTQVFSKPILRKCCLYAGQQSSATALVLGASSGLKTFGSEMATCLVDENIKYYLGASESAHANYYYKSFIKLVSGCLSAGVIKTKIDLLTHNGHIMFHPTFFKITAAQNCISHLLGYDFGPPSHFLYRLGPEVAINGLEGYINRGTFKNDPAGLLKFLTKVFLEHEQRKDSGHIRTDETWEHICHEIGL